FAITDTTAPKVTSLTPTPGSTVGSVIAVIATFNEDLDPSTADDANFVVSHPGPDNLWNTADDVPVPGAVAYQAATRSARFTPAIRLPNAEYRVWLNGTSSLADTDGNPLDGEFGGTFPSGNNTPGGDFLATFTVHAVGPRVAHTSPGPGEFVGQAMPAIVVTFDADLAANTVNANTFMASSYRGPDGQWFTEDDTYVQGTVSYEAAARNAIFTPQAALGYGHYAVWLSGSDGGIEAANGGLLDGEFTATFPSGNGAPGGDFFMDFDMGLTLRKNSTEQFRDADNELFELNYGGPGAAQVTFNERPDLDFGADINAITFTGAKSSTTLWLGPQPGGSPFATTVRTVQARNQSLRSLVLNATTVLGDVTIGGGISRLAVGGDLGEDGGGSTLTVGGALSSFLVQGNVTSAANLGRGVTWAEITGALDSAFTARDTIKSLLVGSLGENAHLTSTRGSITSLDCQGELNGRVTAAQSLVGIRANGDIGAILEATLDVKSVFTQGSL
ncbi:MAG: hypothetical protein FJ279_38900, partial [Planctomycetes bacterium]|nr:hypothetical protein [Planctomycetota bacterium]